MGNSNLKSVLPHQVYFERSVVRRLVSPLRSKAGLTLLFGFLLPILGDLKGLRLRSTRNLLSNIQVILALGAARGLSDFMCRDAKPVRVGANIFRNHTKRELP